MIVVNNDRHVGLNGSQPRMDAFETIEEWLPISVVLEALSQSLTDGWNMGCGNSPDDSRHCLSLSGLNEHFLEIRFGNPSLLSADLLHIQTEDAGPLRQIVDVATGMEEFEHAAMFYCPALLLGQVELLAVGTLVAQVLFAVLGRVE